MTKTTQIPQENQDITYAVLEEIRNDIAREEERVRQNVQSLDDWPCGDTCCNKAQKKIVGEPYGMGGGADYETVTTYDPDTGKPDDFHVVYVEHEEHVFVDVQCSSCNEIYAVPYSDLPTKDPCT